MGLNVYKRGDIRVSNILVRENRQAGIQLAINDKCLGFQHGSKSPQSIISVSLIELNKNDFSEVKTIDLPSDFVKIEGGCYIVDYQKPYELVLKNTLYKLVFVSNEGTFETEIFQNIVSFKYVKI
jgi:hypothetical protein